MPTLSLNVVANNLLNNFITDVRAEPYRPPTIARNTLGTYQQMLVPNRQGVQHFCDAVRNLRSIDLGRQVVGFIVDCLYTSNPDFDGRQSVDFEYIFVLPKYRGNGYAEQALKKFIGISKPQNVVIEFFSRIKINQNSNNHCLNAAEHVLKKSGLSNIQIQPASSSSTQAPGPSTTWLWQ